MFGLNQQPLPMCISTYEGCALCPLLLVGSLGIIQTKKSGLRLVSATPYRPWLVDIERRVPPRVVQPRWISLGASPFFVVDGANPEEAKQGGADEGSGQGSDEFRGTGEVLGTRHEERSVLVTPKGIVTNQARDLRASAWRFIFDCYAKKKATRPGGPDDAERS